ncbi:hypothetical protein CHS0354_016773 [Potamilus streckersoni]|uniref:Mab-21-like HhH/H2TH-like domain-containing protein n=1 Tax=Potamilus streckersoni TaxID=2493646 RepID=A0AAE0T459_9BIVA|nr:hypothetical protein CHS0354_016773 [Potamilus streckersoni]
MDVAHECTEYVQQTAEYFQKRVMRTKLLNFVIEKIMKIPAFYSGSRAEGVSCVSSDTDFMYEAQAILASSHKEEDRFTDNNKTVSVILDMIDVHPGYTKVKILDGNWHDSSEFALYGNGVRSLCQLGSIYLSNILATEYWSTRLPNIFPNHGLRPETFLHGPCISTKYTSESKVAEIDTMLCIKCEWPEVAKEWVERARKFKWPTQEMIDEIKKTGCNLVPVGHVYSCTKELEWRLSFSKVECLLIWSFNGTQVACLDFMKLFFDYSITPRFPELFPSYFIKTAMFWLIEETDSNFWQPQNLPVCLDKLLLNLMSCLDQKCIRNYFIPENNMMDAKSSEELAKLHEELRIYWGKGGGKWLTLIKGKLSEIDKNEIYCHHILINGLTMSRHLIYNTMQGLNLTDWKEKTMQIISDLKSCGEKGTLPDVCYILSKELEAVLSMHSLYASRFNGKLIYSTDNIEIVEATLKSCAKLSHSTGMLQLAIFYFCLERYSDALTVVQQIEEIYTSQVVHYHFWGRNKTPKDRNYPQARQRPTLEQTMQNYISLDLVLLPCLSPLYPDMIQEKLREGRILFVHPLFFALYLQFCCVYMMGNGMKCEETVEKMQTFVAENIDLLKKTRDFSIVNLTTSCLRIVRTPEYSENYFNDTIKALI